MKQQHINSPIHQEIEIPLSKTKLLLLLIGTIVFIVIGVWFITSPESVEKLPFRNGDIVITVGVIAIAFFGLCFIWIIKKLFDKKPGIIINQSGITDHSSAISVGLIDWADISGVETLQLGSTKILILETIHAEKYINRAKNKLSKRAMKANYKRYGSPLMITSSSLQIKYKELKKIVEREFEKWKQENAQSN